MSATWCGTWPSRNRAEAETKHRAHPILHVFDALTPCLGVQRTPAHLLDLRLIDLLGLDPCERDPCEMTCDFRRFKRKEWPVLFRPSPAGFDSTANASRRRTNHQLLLVRTARFTTNSGSSVPSSPASAFLAVITDIAARDVSVMAAVLGLRTIRGSENNCEADRSGFGRQPAGTPAVRVTLRSPRRPT